MKQVLQHFRNGAIELADVPCPTVRPGHLLIQTSTSLISPGTERMLVEFGQAGFIGKARAQPERVRQVLSKIRTDGVRPTLDAVLSRLDEPFALGYSNVGRVTAVGAGVAGFAPGDRVVSNGGHAEVVCVPATLAAKIPAAVSDEAASFTVQGAIALNGVRLLAPTLGESFAVIGLGLLGLLTAQLLRAHGGRVLGIEINPARRDLAQRLGIEVAGGDAVGAARQFTQGRGIDGVVITASTKSNEIVGDAAHMCRKRGRIVLVGVVGLELQRSDFYEKELTFQVACSYGPGRYDPGYESAGHDYPVPFVRWTAGRNFEAILDLLAREQLAVTPLVTHRVPHAEASQAYEAVLTDSSALGVVLTYPQVPRSTARVVLLDHAPAAAAAVSSAPTAPVVGVIGAGQFAKQVLLPAIAAKGCVLHTIASAGGVSSLSASRKFGATQATTDYRELLRPSPVTTVFIATRHDSHARLVCEALEAGKHVFVEKPLSIDLAGLEQVRAGVAAHPELQLLVGFNRRFAPHATKVRALLDGRTRPVAVHILVNAGDLPTDHWAVDPEVGGGRIIGEACHFIDLALFLVGHPIATVQATRMPAPTEESTTINLTFADGSLATIQYWTNGSRAHPKEQIDVFSDGRILTIDNWRRLRAYDWRGAPRLWQRQDKGHRAEVGAFLDRVANGGAPLIPFAEIDMVTRAALAAVASAAEGTLVQLTSP